MNRLTKTGLGAIVALFITFLAVLIFFAQYQQTDAPATSAELQSVVESEGQVGNPEPDSQPVERAVSEDSAGQGRGKRIVEVPDTRRDIEASTHEREQEHVTAISNAIESALSGNVEDAWTIVHYAYRCDKVPVDEATLQANIEHSRARSYRGIPPMKQGIGLPHKFFDTFEEWAHYRWRLFEDCQSTRELLGDDLRSRIQAQAENGNVVARFLYAMWTPTPSGGPEALFAWSEYTNLASEFSQQNVSEGEPLGMLALGLSYWSVNLFSPLNPNLGAAFLLAAEECGMQKSILEEVEMWDQIPQLSPDIRDTSDAIVQQFCK